MKFCTLIFILILFISCNEKAASIPVAQKDVKQESSLYLVRNEFQTILDSTKVKGSILIYDLNADTYHSNDFDWAKVGRLPASTFKIANSIVGLETGVVEDDSTLFKWDGTPRRLKVWEQDLIFKEAFHRSCVPCYQEIARKVGVSRMQKTLEKLNYGNMFVSDTTIDNFWLEGESKISQLQQVDFLKRFYASELPIAERTHDIMYELMEIEEKDSYRLSGKTGWAIRNGQNNGWFVGYLETKGNVYFFAVNVDPEESFNMDLFPRVRNEVAMKAFQKMKIID